MVLNGQNYRTLTDAGLGAALGALGSSPIRVFMFPKWWEDYVRLVRVVKILRSRFSEVRVSFCFSAGGHYNEFPILLPTLDSRNSVMMGFDALIASFVSQITFDEPASGSALGEKLLAEAANEATAPLALGPEGSWEQEVLEHKESRDPEPLSHYGIHEQL
jgi:hypothetical protein